MILYDAPMKNSKVTIELGDLIDSGFELWDFDYPSYYKDEEKTAFEKKVIDHYFFRQIGQETPGRFKHYFKTRIREIMPYYIELYKSAEFLSFDDDGVLKSYDLTETFEEDREDSGSSESSVSTTRNDTNSADLTRKFSNTPQGSVSNLDNYLTEATVEDNTVTVSGSDDSEASGSSSSSGKVTHTLRRVGNIGVQTLGEELTKNRNAILNIDKMIIEELSDLFLGVY